LLIWEGLTRTYRHPTPDTDRGNAAVWQNMAKPRLSGVGDPERGKSG